MEFCCETAAIECTSKDALALFGDPLRLPEWAIEFCQSIEPVDNGYLAQTVEGPRYIKTRVDKEMGVADICSGATPDLLDDILYVRVTPIGKHRSHVSMVYPHKKGTPNEFRELAAKGLKKELDHTKRLLELGMPSESSV